MAKTCKHRGCNNLIFSKEYCKFHQYIRLDKILQPPKKQKKIKKFSTKMRKLSVEYSTLRGDFLKEKPLCEAKLDSCTRVATDVHHMEGRGKNLLNIKTWLSVCRNCHTYIELNPLKAKELGFSKSRLKNK